MRWVLQTLPSMEWPSVFRGRRAVAHAAQLSRHRWRGVRGRAALHRSFAVRLCALSAAALIGRSRRPPAAEGLQASGNAALSERRCSCFARSPRVPFGEQMQFQIPSGLYTSDTVASLALILALMVMRVVAGRALRRRENLSETVARRWSANVRNALVLIALIGLIMIWAPQLRTFALSLTALAVAIVVATKELILCLSGAAFRTFTRAFSVGDTVEIGSSKGEVVDLNLLALRLKEFDAREGSVMPTGRTLILPYSLLFSSPAKVLPHATAGASHSFMLTFNPDVDIFSLRPELEAVAAKALEDAEPRRSAAAGAKAARILLQFRTSDIGKYRVEVTITGCAYPQQVENAVSCAIGSLVHSRIETADSGRSAVAPAPDPS